MLHHLDHLKSALSLFGAVYIPMDPIILAQTRSSTHERSEMPTEKFGTSETWRASNFTHRLPTELICEIFQVGLDLTILQLGSQGSCYSLHCAYGHLHLDRRRRRHSFVSRCYHLCMSTMANSSYRVCLALDANQLPSTVPAEKSHWTKKS